ncbi:5'-nucleotidase, lipoprotein e(P4) family [Clostridium botulinum]|uniref:5'-nucleotidase n=1 Tax=Clostridium botulinum C/D str. DC5 TaxID=1443128 RepID=A0A0A0IGB9_CLOBO|nr:5'-nucleotidase, lipoprotein e(P4) family [Clostridium botulinum]KEI01299.1 5'-nucleotidase [Clostridium botulinum C/D str. BKT75002]KEI13081.1 5'-nucleotidase [Clostridium botulinum C/D str. BKT2873]KGN00033.1 5'-nucleotidase [Clostridium botulinum C/D str. DC5]KOC56041.1 5'-nucleotidase [Clostridium botulinum]KOC57751.1 5'-nucleotidase [Clostridium botulinum]
MKKKIISFILTGAISLGIGAAGGAVWQENHRQLNEGNVLAVNWQQTSGEINALRLQAFNSAKKSIDEIVKKPTQKPYAVVLDIDETVLDNSMHAGYLINTGEKFTNENFNEWCKEIKANAIAGAVDFTNYAKKKGVDVFYVSNRDPKVLDETLKNLKKVGLANPDAGHVLLKQDTDNKEIRWDKIRTNHNLVMYCGDNLGDFPEYTARKTPNVRKEVVNKVKNKFGEYYIILPNAVYGDFEASLYNWNFQKSDKKKLQDRLNSIKSFK